MNRIKLLSALIFTMLLSACSSDSDDNSVPSPTLAGQWNLVNISGGIAGIDQDYSAGTIIWDFDATTNTIEVTNNTTDSSQESMLPTGSYPYSVEANTTMPELCDLNMIIDNINFGCFDLTQNQLMISQVETDGFIITLAR